MVNTQVQPQTHPSQASYAPTIGVSVGDITLPQSFVENGSFPSIFSQNDQQNPQLFSGLSQPFITGGRSVNGGILLQNHPENNLPQLAHKTTSLSNGFPTITTLQNITATTALTAQCTDAVTVQSNPSFPSFTAITGAQGSMPSFVQQYTQPLTSHSISSSLPDSHTHIPIVSSSEPSHSSFSVTSTKTTDSQHISSQPISSKQTKAQFASLFKHSSLHGPIP